MSEYIPGREVVEVKKWTMELVKDRLMTMIVEDADTEQEERTLQAIYKSISEDINLVYTEQCILDDFLNAHMQSKIEDLARYNGLTVSDIDTLSMYSDAWGLYCI